MARVCVCVCTNWLRWNSNISANNVTIRIKRTAVLLKKKKKKQYYYFARTFWEATKNEWAIEGIFRSRSEVSDARGSLVRIIIDREVIERGEARPRGSTIASKSCEGSFTRPRILHKSAHNASRGMTYFLAKKKNKTKNIQLSYGRDEPRIKEAARQSEETRTCYRYSRTWPLDVRLSALKYDNERFYLEISLSSLFIVINYDYSDIPPSRA